MNVLSAIRPIVPLRTQMMRQAPRKASQRKLRMQLSLTTTALTLLNCTHLPLALFYLPTLQASDPAALQLLQPILAYWICN